MHNIGNHRNMRYILFLLLAVLFSCNNGKKDKEPEVKKNQLGAHKQTFVINSPIPGDTLKIGETLEISISVLDTAKKIDTINLYLNNNLIYSSSLNRFSVPLTQNKVGRGTLLVEVISGKNKKQKSNIDLFFLSDIEPKSIQYSIINEYPHSKDNFTEGLVYQNGFMFEGTGDWGKSALVKTNLKTGEVLESVFLPSNIFGEGIAILNNKIIQLTYKSQEGYVYRKEDFNLIKKFSYSFSPEGWGLTNNNENLIMSNGTDKLFVLDSTYYSMLKEIQICDNIEPIDSINELEYFEGIVYANIWMDNRIAKIEYNTGKVLGYIDMKEIVPTEYKNDKTNVLNGIAINPQNGNLFVTGKRWSKIYEIKLY